MNEPIKKIAVIGDGAWGTTLAVLLGKKNFPVNLWGPFPKYVQRVSRNRYNSKFLPGIRIPASVTLEERLDRCIAEVDLIIFAVPSKFTPAILKKIKATKINLKDKAFLSVTKGIDTTNLMRMSQIIENELGKIPLAVLSGPTIAIEVAKGIPSTAVIASPNSKLAKRIQAVINCETFRIYTNTDIIGVELGGSIKNIIALACGVCDGLGFGTNTKAAILTRGLTEMARLGKILGARNSTFAGLSGLGDLATTCFSPQSRNRTVEEQLGKGKSLKEIMEKMESVAEGVETVKAVYKLAQKHKLSMPITTEIYNILYNRKTPAKAVADLMTRKVKAE
ncbi:MAG: NAD(P)-dependent glycerol-3-phosphate dehydrogenase [Candidatus Omnitrophica bacterium]|nr:NAD(P)-dependent glycerol-3-phosphate dehydrogenase [Candidatus Omnitrophota bacterium]